MEQKHKQMLRADWLSRGQSEKEKQQRKHWNVVFCRITSQFAAVFRFIDSLILNWTRLTERGIFVSIENKSRPP